MSFEDAGDYSSRVKCDRDVQVYVPWLKTASCSFCTSTYSAVSQSFPPKSRREKAWLTGGIANTRCLDRGPIPASSVTKSPRVVLGARRPSRRPPGYFLLPRSQCVGRNTAGASANKDDANDNTRWRLGHVLCANAAKGNKTSSLSRAACHRNDVAAQDQGRVWFLCKLPSGDKNHTEVYCVLLEQINVRVPEIKRVPMGKCREY